MNGLLAPEGLPFRYHRSKQQGPPKQTFQSLPSAHCYANTVTQNNSAGDWNFLGYKWLTHSFLNTGYPLVVNSSGSFRYIQYHLINQPQVYPISPQKPWVNHTYIHLLFCSIHRVRLGIDVVCNNL